MIFKIIDLFRRTLGTVYSLVIKSGFRNVGHGFKTEYPLRIHGGERISIGINFSSFARNRIEAFSVHNGHPYQSEIIIGDNVSINFDCHIASVNKIIIGNDVLIASRVFITDHFHGEIDTKSLQIAPSKRKVVSKGPIIIEDGVWIGEGVCILPNVTVGRGSIIGANAVVTKNFPENSVIGGIPARLIKRL